MGKPLTLNAPLPRWRQIGFGLLPIIVLIALWWLFTRGAVEERTISSEILPSPYEVVKSMPDLVMRRSLFSNVLVSLRRVGISYALAVAVTLPLGIAMGSSRSCKSMFSPVTTASGYIPIATLVPLTMSWFGTGEKQKVFFLAMAFAIYLLPMIFHAIESVPDVYSKTALTLGASRWQVIWRVLIPVAMPEIYGGMRLAFGVGWTYLVLAEVVVLDDGLGMLVAQSQRRGPREHIYLVILTIAVIAWIADLLWTKVGERLFPYKVRR